MKTAEFDFELPSRLVALRPAEPRDSARLLVVYGDGRLEHRSFQDLPILLRKGDTLAFNDSRVVPVRLVGYRLPRAEGGEPVRIEITLQTKGIEAFSAFAKPARRLRQGDRLEFPGGLKGQILRRGQDAVELTFNLVGDALAQAISSFGTMPLPPYIAKLRKPDDRDRIDYQTIYAKHDGSIAAPTAGLHFTDALIDRLAHVGIENTRLTLHVGAGTFLPVKTEEIDSHVMHAEHLHLSADSANRLNIAHARGGRVVAVGTTSLRSIETAAASDGHIGPYDGDTSIFIVPGYRFKAVDVLITNFHLPRSTLFMLVCAFCGIETMRKAYAEAIAHQYRFYSYGDACLLFRPS